jgi:hypothetical protein
MDIDNNSKSEKMNYAVSLVKENQFSYVKAAEKAGVSKSSLER